MSGCSVYLVRPNLRYPRTQRHHKRMFGLLGSVKNRMPRKTEKFYFFGSWRILIYGDVTFASFHLICRFMNSGSPHLLCCLVFPKLSNHYETLGAEKSYLLSPRIFTGP
jgi:hypothetical protein